MNFQPFIYHKETLLKLYQNFACPNGLLNPNQYQYDGIYNSLLLPSSMSILPEVNRLVYQPNHHIEQEKSITVKSELYTLKQEDSQLIVKSEGPLSLSPHSQFSCHYSNDSSLQFKIELDNMIGFLLSSMQKREEICILKMRMNYSQNPLLLQIYDNLVRKYSTMKKSKEDIIRFILRKAIKTIKDWTMKKAKVSRKKAGILFCQKYLLMDVTKLQESGININTEDEIIEFAMPYYKKSKNKTMNMNFVLDIFQTDAFIEVYQHFLPELEVIIQQDNLKRKEKFISYILECARTNNLSKINNFSRMPGLDVWTQDCKNVAIGIMPGKRFNLNNMCKMKKNS